MSGIYLSVVVPFYNEESNLTPLHEEIIEVLRKLKLRSEIIYVNVPKGRYDFEVERRYGSSDKLKAITGFIPNTPLEVGLVKIYNDWFVIQKCMGNKGGAK